MSSRIGRRVKLSNFQEAQPRFLFPQEYCVDWLARAHAAAEAARGSPDFNPTAFAEKSRKLFSRFGVSSEIGFRGMELEDGSHFDWDRMRIFNFKANPRGAGIGARMEFFSEAADRIFEKFYPKQPAAGRAAPDGILHVTCTGYVSPSAAQRLVARRGWHQATTVSHAYHMGCAAAFPAVGMAQGFWSAFGRRTDIVHTEFCTLHLNPCNRELEQVVVQTLFADGAIRYTALSSEDAEPGLDVLGLREEIVPDSEGAMTWVLSDFGMSMTLAREVPVLIGGALEGFLERLFASCDLSFQERRKDAVFAVHPGGPQIIDRVRDLLGLQDAQVRWSREVLFERGNMSSATLPHVWKKIVESPEVPDKSLVVSMAFAPGLTICGGIFEKS